MLLVIFVFNDHVLWVIALYFLERPGEQVSWIQIFSEEVFEIDQTQLDSIIIGWCLLVEHELEKWEGEFFENEDGV